VSAAEGCGCCQASYAETTDWPAEVSRILYERLERLGFVGRSVLEIGCGHGRLLVGALVAGGRMGTGVELDAEALGDARERADQAGVAAQATFIEGDGAELRLPRHDIVVLDRVICCYRDADRLLARSLTSTALTYAMTVPESRGLRGAWNRVAYAFGGILDTIRGEERVYLHDLQRLERSITAAGFRLQHRERLSKWHVGIYVRDSAP
jgi:magnesium-protoporphyrin O-methyltransferase